MLSDIMKAVEESIASAEIEKRKIINEKAILEAKVEELESKLLKEVNFIESVRSKVENPPIGVVFEINFKFLKNLFIKFVLFIGEVLDVLKYIAGLVVFLFLIFLIFAMAINR